MLKNSEFFQILISGFKNQIEQIRKRIQEEIKARKEANDSLNSKIESLAELQASAIDNIARVANGSIRYNVKQSFTANERKIINSNLDIGNRIVIITDGTYSESDSLVEDLQNVKWKRIINGTYDDPIMSTDQMVAYVHGLSINERRNLTFQVAPKLCGDMSASYNINFQYDGTSLTNTMTYYRPAGNDALVKAVYPQIGITSTKLYFWRGRSVIGSSTYSSSAKCLVIDPAQYGYNTNLRQAPVSRLLFSTSSKCEAEKYLVPYVAETSNIDRTYSRLGYTYLTDFDLIKTVTYNKISATNLVLAMTSGWLFRINVDVDAAPELKIGLYIVLEPFSGTDGELNGYYLASDGIYHFVITITNSSYAGVTYTPATIPTPTSDDAGKVLMVNEDGSLSWKKLS